jgi:hypothetical protein
MERLLQPWKRTLALQKQIRSSGPLAQLISERQFDALIICFHLIISLKTKYLHP